MARMHARVAFFSENKNSHCRSAFQWGFFLLFLNRFKKGILKKTSLRKMFEMAIWMYRENKIARGFHYLTSAMMAACAMVFFSQENKSNLRPS